MIHRLIGLVLIAVAVIVGLSHYLSPDDLKDCPRPGSEQCRVEHQQRGAVLASVPHRDGLRDVGNVRSDRTLDLLWGDVLAT